MILWAYDTLSTLTFNRWQLYPSKLLQLGTQTSHRHIPALSLTYLKHAQNAHISLRLGIAEHKVTALLPHIIYWVLNGKHKCRYAFNGQKVKILVILACPLWANSSLSLASVSPLLPCLPWANNSAPRFSFSPACPFGSTQRSHI